MFGGSDPTLIPKIPSYLTAYVDKGGNDSSGQVGNKSRPFQTFVAAIRAVENLNTVSPYDGMGAIEVGVADIFQDCATSLQYLIIRGGYSFVAATRNITFTYSGRVVLELHSCEISGNINAPNCTSLTLLLVSEATVTGNISTTNGTIDLDTTGGGYFDSNLTAGGGKNITIEGNGGSYYNPSVDTTGDVTAYNVTIDTVTGVNTLNLFDSSVLGDNNATTTNTNYVLYPNSIQKEIARVDFSGNDSTGQVGNPGAPFKTVQGAINAIEAGSFTHPTIHIDNNTFGENVTTSLPFITFIGKFIDSSSITSITSSLTGDDVQINLINCKTTGNITCTNDSDVEVILRDAQVLGTVSNTGAAQLTVKGNSEAASYIGNITASGGGGIRLFNVHVGNNVTCDDAVQAFGGCNIGQVVSATVLTLQDSRVAPGFNSATSTVYSDFILAQQMSITRNDGGFKLVNDASSPGNNMTYGTDSGGTKGWQSGGAGTSGYSGYSGQDGVIGVDGQSGYSGFSGKSGYSGFSGLSGYSGFCGLSGYSGFCGLSGYSGFSGPSGYSGFCGLSGYSGFCGLSGYSGFCGLSGYSGYSGSGISGYSGYSGSGISGYSGYSGSGLSGYSGFCGLSGYSGFSGKSGYSGFCGLSGYSGFCGLSGYSGFSGPSGYSGYCGLSGYSGFCGLSGYSGFSGPSGYSGYCGLSGYSGYSGSGISGYSGYSGSGISGYSGYSGNFGGNSQPYTFDNGTTNADPGSGKLRFDNATLLSVQHIYVDDLNSLGLSMVSFLEQPNNFVGNKRGIITIYKQGSPGNYVIFNVTAGAGQSAGYHNIPVSAIDAAGSFSNLDPVIYSFSQPGFSGYSGFSGLSGYSGYSGNLNIFSNKLTTSSTTSSATTFDTASITPTPNRLVIVAVSSTTASGTVNTPNLTGNSLTYVNIGVVSPSSNTKIALYRAMGTSTTAQAIHISYSGQTQTSCAWSVVEFANVDISGTNGSGAVATASQGTSAGATSYLISIPTFQDIWDGVYAAFMVDSNQVLTGDQTVLDTQNVTGNSLLTEWSPFNQTAVTAFGTTTDFAGIGFEIRSASAGTSGYSGKSGYSGYSGSGISGYSGYCGLSGYSGYSSTSGYSGFSGPSGYSGFSGPSGYSGYSGSGISGYSGYSGSGVSGYSGFCGLSGYSGFSGDPAQQSGYSGYSGISGYSGFCGLSGYSGFCGLSGYSGFCGLSGYSGFCGLSGYSGYSGPGGIAKVLFVDSAEIQEVGGTIVSKAGTVTGTAGVGSSLFLQRILIPAVMNITEIDVAMSIGFPATNQGAGTMSRSMVIYSLGNSTSLASVVSVSGASVWSTGTSTTAGAASLTQFQGGWSTPLIQPMTFAASSLAAGEYVVGQLFNFAQASSTWTLGFYGILAETTVVASAATNLTSATLGALSSGGFAAASGITGISSYASSIIPMQWSGENSASGITGFTLSPQTTSATIASGFTATVLFSGSGTIKSSATLWSLIGASSNSNLISSIGVTAGSIHTATASLGAVTNVGLGALSSSTLAQTTLPNFGYIGTGSTTSNFPTVFINGIMSTGAIPTAITLTSTAVTYSGSAAFQQPWFALVGT